MNLIRPLVFLLSVNAQRGEAPAKQAEKDPSYLKNGADWDTSLGFLCIGGME